VAGLGVLRRLTLYVPAVRYSAVQLILTVPVLCWPSTGKASACFSHAGEGGKPRSTRGVGPRQERRRSEKKEKSRKKKRKEERKRRKRETRRKETLLTTLRTNSRYRGSTSFHDCRSPWPRARCSTFVRSIFSLRTSAAFLVGGLARVDSSSRPDPAGYRWPESPVGGDLARGHPRFRRLGGSARGRWGSAYRLAGGARAEPGSTGGRRRRPAKAVVLDCPGDELHRVVRVPSNEVEGSRPAGV